MTAGTKSYKGLAIPVNGESTIYQITAATDVLTIKGASGMTGDFLNLVNSSGTELFHVNNLGALDIITGASVSPTTEMCAYFEGTTAVGATGGWFAAMQAKNIVAGTPGAASQLYAACFYLDTSAGGTNSGGRDAVLNLLYYYGNSQTPAAASWINMDDLGSNVPTLLTLPNNSAGDGGCFQAAGSTPTCTHLLTIYCANTKYYIMCAAQSSA
jgi:hypothetical protein